MPKNSRAEYCESDEALWVFAYASLLANAAHRPDVKHHDVVPCRLNGWERNWRAARQDGDTTRKRFVDAMTFEPAPAFAFASIDRNPSARINGVAYRVDEAALVRLGFREQGYDRVEVTDGVVPYSGYAIRGRVFAYVDVTACPERVPVSYAYANIGLAGAAKWDAVVPGFLDDYCRSTALPTGGFANTRFIDIGPDGRTLWLLHLDSGLRTLLVVLPVSVLGACSVCPEETLEWSTASPDAWESVDRRYHLRDMSGGMPDGLALFGRLVVAARGADPKSLITDPSWLVRIACLARADRHPEIARALDGDPDPWVRRAARAILSCRQ